MSNGTVRIVKLKTGEELIAVVWRGSERILLKKPCILLPTAQNQIGIAPWGFFTKEPKKRASLFLAQKFYMKALH